MTRDESRPRRPAPPKRRPPHPDKPERASATSRAQATTNAPLPKADITAPPPRQRIAKLMARAGLCSRRDAEAWILDGRVTLNGTKLTSPAVDVDPTDVVLVDDVPLPSLEKTRLFLFHKPRGLVTSDYDPEGRPTVADFLRDNWPDGPRTVTIGRLDINTEGLLLLTNDGGLARTLELPKTGWVRRYRVRAKGETDQSVLDALFHGVTIDGVDYAGIEAKLDRVQGANCWLTMGLREGKNREIKRVLEHIGLEVNRLIRLSFGPFQLLDLAEGAVSEVRTRVLRDQLGEALAKEAGVDFGSEAPPEATVERSPSKRRSDDRRPRPEAVEPDDGPAPIRERPQRGARRHVSQLRDESSANKGPRKRIERSQTEDRRARVVAVERVSAAVPEGDRPRQRSTDRPAANHGASKRGHESPSARGKRERISRSGGAPSAEARPSRDDRRPSRSERPERQAGRGPDERRSVSKGDGPDFKKGARPADRFGGKRPPTGSDRPDGRRPPRDAKPSDTRRGTAERGSRDDKAEFKKGPRPADRFGGKRPPTSSNHSDGRRPPRDAKPGDARRGAAERGPRDGKAEFKKGPRTADRSGGKRPPTSSDRSEGRRPPRDAKTGDARRTSRPGPKPGPKGARPTRNSPKPKR